MTHVPPDERLVLRDASQRLNTAGTKAALADPGSGQGRRWQEWRDGNSSLFAASLERLHSSSQLPAGSARDVVAQCAGSGRLNPGHYADRPDVSILMEYFKRPWMVSKTAILMKESCSRSAYRCELVVNVDNPHEWAAWAAQAAVLGGFLVPVFSFNAHEARGYNRAARAARGRYLVIWQDDQVPPVNGKWVDDMVAVYEAYPKVAVLGMNSYRLCRHREGTNRAGHDFPFGRDPKTAAAWHYAQVGEPREGGGGGGRRRCLTLRGEAVVWVGGWGGEVPYQSGMRVRILGGGGGARGAQGRRECRDHAVLLRDAVPWTFAPWISTLMPMLCT